jgi:hypothetical protein
MTSTLYGTSYGIATATQSGMVSTGTQTFAGDKTFSGSVSTPALKASTQFCRLDWTPTGNASWTTGTYSVVAGVNGTGSGAGTRVGHFVPTGNGYSWAINSVVVGDCDPAGAWTFPVSVRSAKVDTTAGITASLGNAGIEDFLAIPNLSTWIITAHGSTDTSQYAHVMARANGAGTVVVSNIGNSLISIIAGGTNLARLVNSTVTQTITWSALRMK